MFEIIPTKEQFDVFGEWRKKEHEMCRGGTEHYPTNEDVLACVVVYRFMLELATGVGQEMFGLWVAMQYQHFNQLAHNRKLL